MASHACKGAGIRACWTTSATVLNASDAVTASLRAAADAAPTRTCDRVPVGTTGRPMQADSCFVRVRFGSHGVFVFAEPLTERDAAGVAKVTGTRVSVQAS